MADQQPMLDALAALINGVTIQQTALTAQQATQQVHHAELMQHLHNNHGIRSAVLSTIPVFSGGAMESLSDWEATIDRTATAEHWDDAAKRRVAIGKLAGTALAWQNQSGFAFITWAEWVAGLRVMFQPRMSLTEWCLLVEGRRQAPGEPGAQYAMEKSKLCRMCPHAITEAEMIPYFIRGLQRPEQVAALLGNPPQTITAFVDTIRRLEQIGNSSTAASTTMPPSPTSAELLMCGNAGVYAPCDTVAQTMAAINDRLRRMEAAVQSAVRRPPNNWQNGPNHNQNWQNGGAQQHAPGYQHGGAQQSSWSNGSSQQQAPQQQAPQQQVPSVVPPVPTTGPPGHRPSYTARAPRLPLAEIKCFRCGLFGHYADNCAEGTSATVAAFYQGNDQADHLGQGRLSHQ